MQRYVEAIPWLQSADLTRSGDHVAYELRSCQGDEDVYTLWVYDCANEAPRELTKGRQPRWSPDGRTLAFTAERAGRDRLFLIAADGSDLRELGDLPGPVRGRPEWSPDGARIAVAVGSADPVRDGHRPYRVTRRVWRGDGIGDVEAALTELWLLDAATGEGFRATDHSAISRVLGFSPDGVTLLYRVSCAPDAADPEEATLRVFADGRSHVVVGMERKPAQGAWLADGAIAFVGAEPASKRGAGERLYVRRLDGAVEARSDGSSGTLNGWLQSDAPSPLLVDPSELLPDPDDRLLVRVQRGGAMEIDRLATAGELRHTPVQSGERACYPCALSATGNLLLSAVSSFHAPLQLTLVDLRDASERQITELGAPDVRARLRLPRLRALTVDAPDGVALEGWFAHPPEAELPLPTVLYAHGGPHIAMGHIFYGDAHELLDAGFGVLLANHRGSSGYGDAFATALHGRWGAGDGGDLLALVDETVKRGWADPERLGVTGISGGGYLTTWLVGQTTRFKAAVAENPVTSFASFFGTSDFGLRFVPDELGGRAPDDVGRWWHEHSPLRHAWECRTPTLLIQGEADWRCPPEQSEQFYNALHDAGCEVEMLRIPGSPHLGTVVGLPVWRRAQDEALLDWMKRFV